MAIRDITEHQFKKALERHGMVRTGFMGYVEMGIEGHRLSVCRFNAGKNLRAQLAYLVKAKEKWEAQLEAERNPSLDGARQS
jgi:hypothetical protein